MRDQEIIGLYEAYASIYAQEEVEQLDEGRNTSLSALSRESQKRKEDKERGRPETESEKHGRLMLGKFRPGASKEERAEGGRERLRDRGKVPQKGGKDMFEHILEHLVAEGYADTNKAAIAIMANMSEEWKQSIVEEVLDEASVTDDRVRRNQMAFGSNYTPPRDWDQSANRGRGTVLNAKQKEKQRRKRLAKSAEEN